MGGDGGSIPGRADVVRTAGFKFVRNLGGMGYKPNTQVRAGGEAYGPNETKRLRWTTCAISQEPLRPPLSVCRHGLIYNREKLIERLLNAKSNPLPQDLNHIRKFRRDVRDAVVEFDHKTGHLICPVLKNEFEAGVKGVLLWSCGCMVSRKALCRLAAPSQIDPSDDRAPLRVPKRQRSYCDLDTTGTTTQTADEAVPEQGGNCPVCSKPFQKSDIVDLIPDEPLGLATVQGNTRRAASRSTTNRGLIADTRELKRHRFGNGVETSHVTVLRSPPCRGPVESAST